MIQHGPGELPLTRGQLRVLAAYAQTGTYDGGAAALGIGGKFFRDQLTEAYARLGIRRLGKSSGIRAFAALGWLQVPPDLIVPVRREP